MMSAESKKLLCKDPHSMDYTSLIIIAVVLVFFIILYNVNANKKTPEERKKIEKEEEKKRIKEKRAIEKVVSSSDLGVNLKRLKRMYNDGHLSKVEFEKAKNKLLK